MAQLVVTTSCVAVCEQECAWQHEGSRRILIIDNAHGIWMPRRLTSSKGGSRAVGVEAPATRSLHSSGSNAHIQTCRRPYHCLTLALRPHALESDSDKATTLAFSAVAPHPHATPTQRRTGRDSEQTLQGRGSIDASLLQGPHVAAAGT